MTRAMIGRASVGAVVFLVAIDGGSYSLPSRHAGEGRRTTYRNREDLAFVPLFVKLPNQRSGRVVERVVQSIDVLPTIADAAGIEVPWRIDGRSALGSRDLGRVSVEGASFDAADLVARRDRAVRAQATVFGARKGWDRVLGPPSELLHMKAARPRVARLASAVASSWVTRESRGNSALESPNGKTHNLVTTPNGIA